MSNQALYRKWRAQDFDGILGQDHITRTLRNQIRAGRLGHAYLFAGVRGTGKTSTARILAKAANCIGDSDDPPCNVCAICRSISEGASLDLIEIDAASNRGIDEIRDLREHVNFMPSECRFKVYVIDEVHMLTNEAFNALLKTLEEPPAHVIFVLCTTEPHRLPDTILSRCQRFDFKRATPNVVRQKLAFICAQEGLQVSDEALSYLARRGAGSFRDAESLLDQVAAYGGGDISLDLVQAVLGTVPHQIILAIASAVALGDVPAGFRAIAAAFANGADARQLVVSLVEQLRALLLLRIGVTDSSLLLSSAEAEDLAALAAQPTFSLRRLVQGIRSFSEAGEALRSAARPEIPLELALVEAVLVDADVAGAIAFDATTTQPVVAPASMASTPRPQPAAETKTAPLPAANVAPDREQAAVARSAPAEPPELQEASLQSSTVIAESVAAPAAPGARVLSLEAVQGNWQRVVARMRAQSPQLQAVLRSVYPVAVAGNLVTLACDGAFHRDRLSEDKRREQVEQVLSDVLGAPSRIECIVDREARARPQGSSDEGPKDLFENADAEAERRRQLLNHPAVKDLTERGGQVRRVELNTDNTQEEG
jgi:DNA polymerase-3 subunit gamma/tau